MDQWIMRSLETKRTPMMLLGLFGAVALILSAIGIYGVLASGVARSVEFGIRQALGADSRSIVSLVLKQGLITVSLGIALGSPQPGGWRVCLQTMLFGVDAHDAPVPAGVTLLLLAVALAACHPGSPRHAGGSDGGLTRYIEWLMAHGSGLEILSRRASLSYSIRNSSTSNTNIPCGDPGRPPYASGSGIQSRRVSPSTISCRPSVQPTITSLTANVAS
jgi:hypothetical protein